MARIPNLHNHILLSIKALANEHGIGKINMRMVAAQAGVSLGTLYNYYPSKAHLVAAVVEDFWLTAMSDMDFSQLGTSDFISSLEHIYSRLRTYLREFRHDWLLQLEDLPASEKTVAMDTETLYLDKIKGYFALALEHEAHAQAKYSSEEIPLLAAFIFDNIFSMLRRDENFTFFAKLLKEILY